MNIVGYTDNMDLRRVVTKSGYLREIANRFKLKTMQAVCFTNKSQTRFRLIFKVRDSVFLCSPEVDDTSKLSVYLRISEELARLAGLKGTKVKLENLTEHTKSRILKMNPPTK